MDDLDYFFNSQSLHLSVCSLPQRSTQLRADIYYDIQISLSIIHPSVCLFDWLLSVQGRGSTALSIYIDIVIILSIDNLYICVYLLLSGEV